MNVADQPVQSAVLLCVPEADDLVATWRGEADPAAARGIPPHVTLLAPFLPLAAIDEGVLGELEWFFRGVDAFDLAFDRVEDAAGVVHLLPVGDDLDDLMRALARRWPEADDERVPVSRPHLTVAATADDDLRARAEQAVAPRLPLAVRARQAALWITGEDGDWRERAVFSFGPGD